MVFPLAGDSTMRRTCFLRRAAAAVRAPCEACARPCFSRRSRPGGGRGRDCGGVALRSRGSFHPSCSPIYVSARQGAGTFAFLLQQARPAARLPAFPRRAGSGLTAAGSLPHSRRMSAALRDHRSAGVGQPPRACPRASADPAACTYRSLPWSRAYSAVISAPER